VEPLWLTVSVQLNTPVVPYACVIEEPLPVVPSPNVHACPTVPAHELDEEELTTNESSAPATPLPGTSAEQVSAHVAAGVAVASLLGGLWPTLLTALTV
jgi:hypothetical protein